jgi:hypothetical protein
MADWVTLRKKGGGWVLGFRFWVVRCSGLQVVPVFRCSGLQVFRLFG